MATIARTIVIKDGEPFDIKVKQEERIRFRNETDAADAFELVPGAFLQRGGNNVSEINLPRNGTSEDKTVVAAAGDKCTVRDKKFAAEYGTITVCGGEEETC